MKLLKITSFISALSLLGACGTPVAKLDYTNYRKSNPASILILPPINNSPDTKATYGFLTTTTRPLAEAGYYVFPIALVDQAFKENGLQNPPEIHQTPLNKLKDIFGADAVLYITIESYGAGYHVITSDVVVKAKAKLVDTKTGLTLWNGDATASSAETDNNSNLGLAGLLIKAIAKQIVSSVSDQGHVISKTTSTRLFAPKPNGILYGPRSPMYQKDIF
jgi:hypothetical protein